jgi:hypothetical protein
MIRFVDLRTCDIPKVRFAFWNTVEDRFVVIGNDQAWDDWDDFVESAYDCKNVLLRRYKYLCPPWAFKKRYGDNDED